MQVVVVKTSKIMKTFFALLTFFFAVGCVISAAEITTGVYRNADKTEWIAVQGRALSFNIYLKSKRGKELITRKYTGYGLHSNGRFWPSPTTSIDASAGIGAYDWFWDGKNIVRKDPKSGEAVSFTPEPK
jgi:hypothetical protein